MNISYDLIIIAKSSTKALIDITQNCINSARADDADLNIIIMETEAVVPYERVSQTIFYDGDFNYNKALNLGLKYAIGNVHILANNDIIFHPGWSIMGYQMIENSYDSASALSADRRQSGFQRGNYVYDGYSIGKHLTGWCIFITSEAYSKIGKLDESFEFWYSDDIYADQLRAAGLRHGLFCNVQVDHITSCTLSTLTPNLQRRYSVAATKKYKSAKLCHVRRS